MTPVLVDTGYLVALFDPEDVLAASAATYLKEHRHSLVTPSAVIVESCFFLRPRAKAELLTWVRRGGASVLEVPVTAYAHLELTIRKYADQQLDFADAAIVWLAGECGASRILTDDYRDFQILRLKGNRRFDLIEWF